MFLNDSIPIVAIELPNEKFARGTPEKDWSCTSNTPLPPVMEVNEEPANISQFRLIAPEPRFSVDKFGVSLNM